MESYGFVHRDLKPQNIFVRVSPSTVQCKLGDFGLSKHLHNGTLLRNTGYTLDYAAPELRAQELCLEEDVQQDQGEKGDGVRYNGYTSSVDMWSVVIIAYELFTGRLPFNTARLVYFVKGMGMLPLEPLKEVVDEDLVAMVDGLLRVDPEERMGISECCEVLDGWLARCRWNQWSVG